MRNVIIAALAVSSALGGTLSAGLAAAQPGYYGDHDRRDRDDRRDWDRDHDRGDHHWRYYGGRYGYNGYHGHWRTGQRYPYWRDNRYVVEDWRAYNLPPPRAGYRYYRDDNGDIVMAAIASGVIGLIVGNAIASNNQPYYPR
jgi:Ni/Co efflux regulator RcnB